MIHLAISTKLKAFQHNNGKIVKEKTVENKARKYLWASLLENSVSTQ